MEEKKWGTVLDGASLALRQACEKVSEAISRGEAGVKDIRELTTALKELSALRRSLDSSMAKAETLTVEVFFDEDGEGWSK